MIEIFRSKRFEGYEVYVSKKDKPNHHIYINVELNSGISMAATGSMSSEDINALTKALEISKMLLNEELDI